MFTCHRIPCGLVLAAMIIGCGQDHCDLTKIRDYPSPDGRMVLTAFEYCCYDTTGYDTQLQLRPRGAKLKVPGNICTIPFGQEFAVSWRSSSNIIVALQAPILEATNVAGVTVTFEKFDAEVNPFSAMDHER